MNVNERDLSVLQHMIKYIDRIHFNVNRFGDDFETFKSDPSYFDACSMCILQIGELAGHLSKEFRTEYTHIPWRDMITTRNVAAHSYEIFDAETVWCSVKEDIPSLECFCREWIMENGPKKESEI